MSRNFERVKYDVAATLEINGRRFESRLVDLSLKGALLQVANPENLLSGDQGSLNFSLGDDAYQLSMDVEIAHKESETLGVHCLQIDLDSATHLRRILELYTGDSRIVERELWAMLSRQS